MEAFNMNQEYDVIIVGAGPAGIFTALELKEKKPNAKVLMVDMGRTIDHRSCPARTLNRCVGCQRCEINCTLTNDGCCSSYISRVKVTRNLYSSRNGNGLYTENNWTYFPDTCRQCEDPACGNACPVGAIYAGEDGIRRVDTEKCVGCGACTQACPWHMPTVNPVTHKSSKCVMCGACVEGCPSGALSIIPWDEVSAAAQAV